MAANYPYPYFNENDGSSTNSADDDITMTDITQPPDCIGLGLGPALNLNPYLPTYPLYTNEYLTQLPPQFLPYYFKLLTRPIMNNSEMDIENYVGREGDLIDEDSVTTQMERQPLGPLQLHGTNPLAAAPPPAQRPKQATVQPLAAALRPYDQVQLHRTNPLAAAPPPAQGHRQATVQHPAPVLRPYDPVQLHRTNPLAAAPPPAQGPRQATVQPPAPVLRPYNPVQLHRTNPLAAAPPSAQGPRQATVQPPAPVLRPYDPVQLHRTNPLAAAPPPAQGPRQATVQPPAPVLRPYDPVQLHRTNPLAAAPPPAQGPKQATVQPPAPVIRPKQTTAPLPLIIQQQKLATLPAPAPVLRPKQATAPLPPMATLPPPFSPAPRPKFTAVNAPPPPEKASPLPLVMAPAPSRPVMAPPPSRPLMAPPPSQPVMAPPPSQPVVAPPSSPLVTAPSQLPLVMAPPPSPPPSPLLIAQPPSPIKMGPPPAPPKKAPSPPVTAAPSRAAAPRPALDTTAKIRKALEEAGLQPINYTFLPENPNVPRMVINAEIIKVGPRVEKPSPESDDEGPLPPPDEVLKAKLKYIKESQESTFEVLGRLKKSLKNLEDRFNIPHRPIKRAARMLSTSSNESPIKTDKRGEYPIRIRQDDGTYVYILGPNKTQISAHQFGDVDWTNAPTATRGLLTAVFSNDELATHTLTGKPSPAFYGRERPAKFQLDQAKVDDIVASVQSRTNGKERAIRAAITTKCADVDKKYKRKAFKDGSEIGTSPTELEVEQIE